MYITTDAPLPRGPETGGALTPAALFDRLQIDLYLPNASDPCAGCSREFGFDEPSVEAGLASFGIVPESGVPGHRLRVRMFNSERRVAIEPEPDGTVELWIAVPPVDEEGVRELTVSLPTDAVAGSMGTVDAPASATDGPPPPGLVGSWPPAQRVDCAAPPLSNEVCVPGGAYWMGNPRAPAEPFQQIDQQRIVVVAPFYLDATEVSVQALRASGVATATDPFRWSSIHDCNYTAEPGEFEEHPVNCITWTTARQFCLSRPQGGDLPTEAQFEYAAGGLRSALYVWGSDEPGCDDAVWGLPFGGDAGQCQDGPDEVTGRALPTLRPHHGRDELALPTGSIFDLAGNIMEFTLDAFQEPGEGCWVPGVLDNPVCLPADRAASPRTVKGGGFALLPFALRAASRDRVPSTDSWHAMAGFRCARSALPR